MSSEKMAKRLTEEVAAAPCRRDALDIIAAAKPWIHLLHPMERERLLETINDIIAKE